jgi:uncharacterized protein YcfJ
MGWGSLVGMGGLSGAVSSGGSSGMDWGSMFNSSSGSGWGGFFGNVLGGMFGGGSGEGGGNIWGQMLAGGLNGQAQAGMSIEMMKQKGIEDRMTTQYEAQLIDFYKQRDKRDKRVALDTYGQFSDIKKFQPNYKDTPMPQLAAYPKANY